MAGLCRAGLARRGGVAHHNVVPFPVYLCGAAACLRCPWKSFPCSWTPLTWAQRSGWTSPLVCVQAWPVAMCGGWGGRGVGGGSVERERGGGGGEGLSPVWRIALEGRGLRDSRSHMSGVCRCCSCQISKVYREVNGVVVLMGTDTMVRTAGSSQQAVCCGGTLVACSTTPTCPQAARSNWSRCRPGECALVCW